MKILLDTHFFLWAIGDSENISQHHKKMLLDHSNTIYVSSISFVEIAIKSSIGKLTINCDPFLELERAGFEHLDFDYLSASKLFMLPMYHKDPFDRMLIAQSLSKELFIMSDDAIFPKYECQIV